MHMFKFVPPPDTPPWQRASSCCPASVHSSTGKILERGFSPQYATETALSKVLRDLQVATSKRFLLILTVTRTPRKSLLLNSLFSWLPAPQPPLILFNIFSCPFLSFSESTYSCSAGFIRGSIGNVGGL